ncbi:ABC transporter ATP-binding protein [Patulibacter americanus]|uniref:ABC transporter ATP-binding protein n=1 Tax=Patulibacter americanus TaxID=588672 RepID=UPI0003B5F433|nr:ABC transporter ATP-binding protein [Patulibacter americanus]
MSTFMTDVRRRRAASRGRGRRVRDLLGMLRPYRLRLWLLGIALLLSTGAMLAPAPLVQRAVDDGLADGDLNQLTILVVSFVVISLVGLASSVALARLVGWLGARLLSDLRERIFRHLLQMPVSYHERQRAGVLVSRLTNDVDALQQMISSSLVTLVQSLLLLAGSIVILLSLDVQLALITFITIPVLLGASLAFRLASVDAFARTRETIGAITAHLQETLSGVRVIRAYGRERGHLQRFSELGDDNRAANMKTVHLNAAYFPAVEYLSTAAIVIVLLVGGGQAIDGAVTIGVLIGFVTALDNFFGPITDLSNVYTTFQSGMAALDKIGTLLEQESTLTDPEDPKPLPDPLRGELRFDHVTFSYGGTRGPDGEAVLGRTVLEDVCLTIPAGATVALVGETGAGKSTIAKLATRFIDPVQGRVLLDGVDLRDLRQNDLRSRMGIVPQEGYLFSGTVADNIAFGRVGATREEVEAAVDRIGAGEILDALPRGLDTEVGERGTSLSAGQRQLVAFARALIAGSPADRHVGAPDVAPDPDGGAGPVVSGPATGVGGPAILVLDEATANVDLRTERRIEEALQTLLAGRTAVVIAHRLSTIRSADLIVVVDRGRVAESGTHEELLHRDGFYAKLHRDWQHGTEDAAPSLP